MKRLVRYSIPFAACAILAALASWSFLGGKNPAGPHGPAGQAGPAQVWTCSMHPQIRMDHKGVCPLCGMDLTPVDARQDPGRRRTRQSAWCSATGPGGWPRSQTAEWCPAS